MFFSKIDLKNGFNQLPIDEESSNLTGFVVFNKSYVYQRVPFGLKSGPKIFQRVIESILDGILNVFVYIDDIVIFAKDVNSHNETLVKILRVFRIHEVQINFEKSIFLVNEIEVLGYIIKKDEIKINTDKIKNGLIITEPVTKKKIQQVVGHLNWFRTFVKNCSSKLKPLTDLLNQDKHIRWNSSHQKTINDTCKDIVENASLCFPDFLKEFKLSCDASNEGIGATLFQEHGILGFYSKKLNGSELNYSIVEKELYAVLKALKNFENIIQGYKVIVLTDSKNIVTDNKQIEKRIERWRVLLNEYDYEIQHIEGKNNYITDLLSRNILTNTINEKENNLFLFKENILSNHNNDKIKNFLHEITMNLQLKNNKNYSIDTIFEDHQIGKNTTIELEPETEVDIIVKNYHEMFGHSGIVTTFSTLKRYFSHSKLKEKIIKFIDNCILRYKAKYKYGAKSNKINPRITSKEPYSKISLDIYGPIFLNNFKSKKNEREDIFVTNY